MQKKSGVIITIFFLVFSSMVTHGGQPPQPIASPKPCGKSSCCACSVVSQTPPCSQWVTQFNNECTYGSLATIGTCQLINYSCPGNYYPSTNCSGKSGPQTSVCPSS